ncbi:MAG: DUF4976 domain-containing protein, partial [bacterium]|nr:DUF4976 domain-containing protein [bacterium]
LALAGIEIPDHVQGMDMRELFQQPEKELKTEAYSELLGSVMVRTHEHKLALCDDGTGELYDLREEPLEVHNHFNDPHYREIQEELTKKILQHLLSHSRYRSFGGGRHPSDPERNQKFKEIQEKVTNKEYPGLE